MKHRHTLFSLGIDRQKARMKHSLSKCDRKHSLCYCDVNSPPKDKSHLLCEFTRKKKKKKRNTSNWKSNCSHNHRRVLIWSLFTVQCEFVASFTLGWTRLRRQRNASPVQVYVHTWSAIIRFIGVVWRHLHPPSADAQRAPSGSSQLEVCWHRVIK